MLDGRVVGDSRWAEVVPVTDFWQTRPNEGQAATQATEVRIGFTDTALCIGAVLFDDDPEGIIVSDSRRDADLDETDSFQVIIDGFRDHQNGFVFGANPAGIQYDGQVIKEGGSTSGPSNPSGSNEINLDWDITWEVVTSKNEIGWSVEMEIPFKSLRYSHTGMQIWGINFQRNIRRNYEGGLLVAFASAIQPAPHLPGGYAGRHLCADPAKSQDHPLHARKCAGG